MAIASCRRATSSSSCRDDRKVRLRWTAQHRRRAVRRLTAARAARRRWLALVEKHGIMLASARGPVPSVAEAVAGEPIIGSWWAHPKGRAIFAALSELDDSDDVRCFKLIDGK